MAPAWPSGQEWIIAAELGEQAVFAQRTKSPGESVAVVAEQGQAVGFELHRALHAAAAIQGQARAEAKIGPCGD
ncbi:MAG: hypothetical protein LKM39_17340 [Chiayiivirga sp.]|nr:hypothetical protein [Chiayiivirga sp.]